MVNPAGNGYSSAAEGAEASKKEKPPSPAPSLTPSTETETSSIETETTLEARRAALLEVGGPGVRKLTFRERMRCLCCALRGRAESGCGPCLWGFPTMRVEDFWLSGIRS